MRRVTEMARSVTARPHQVSYRRSGCITAFGREGGRRHTCPHSPRGLEVLEIKAEHLGFDIGVNADRRPGSPTLRYPPARRDRRQAPVAQGRSCRGLLELHDVTVRGPCPHRCNKLAARAQDPRDLSRGLRSIDDVMRLSDARIASQLDASAGIASARPSRKVTFRRARSRARTRASVSISLLISTAVTSPAAPTSEAARTATAPVPVPRSRT